MKKNIFNWMMAVALVAAPMALTSCGDDDDVTTNDDQQTVTPVDQKIVVGFEKQTLNEQGFWCGSTEGENLGSYPDDWGGTTTSFANTYKEQGVTFNTTYNLYESEWGNSDYWSGFAISNRTETTFEAITPDQYNNVVGKASQGKNFCVVFTYGEAVTFDNPVKLVSFDYTNSAYTVNSILNGDQYAKKFDKDDFLNCTVTAFSADSVSQGQVILDLASKGTYVDTWKTADLSKLGNNVKFLTFVFDGSDKSEYGLNTPTYLCIDNLVYVQK